MDIGMQSVDSPTLAMIVTIVALILVGAAGAMIVLDRQVSATQLARAREHFGARRPSPA